MAQMPKTTRLIRVVPSHLRPSWQWFPRVDANFLDALQAVLTVSARRVPAPAVVVASGPPFHTFISAYYLSKMFGSKLILDYRDEWTECPFEFVRLGNSDRYWERRCMRAADGLIFATASTRRQTIEGLAPDREKRAHIVRNGWEPDDFGEALNGQAAHNNTDKLTLSFVGNLGDHCPPCAFLADLTLALKRHPGLERVLTVQFIGQKSQTCADQLASFPYSSMLRIRAHITKAEAGQAMRASNALLIFSTKNLARYLPGKLYDYIASGRPVIVHGAAGEAGSIVEDLEVGRRVAEGDVAGLMSALDAVRQNRFSNTSDKVQSWLQQHTREALAARFFGIVDTIVRGDGRFPAAQAHPI